MAQPSSNQKKTTSDPAAPAAPGGSVIVTELYAAHKKVYPRAVTGWFAAWRWALVWATQLVYYGTPWIVWNDRQAVLFDIVHRKFYIFGLVFWPQDVIYLSVLLIIAALSLFLFTAVAGRLWCGYACPQTVYTEIFMWIERLIEGDRNQRIKLDRGAWDVRKLGLKAAKHAVWILVAFWTGFTFVGYVTPIRELWGALASAPAWLGDGAGAGLGPWETFWILFYGFATYGNAGWMREQVCLYMCPYARFQSAMFDRDTLIITYDAERGEPRGARGKSTPRAQFGDCVNCGVCVQVCPTGIDIRDGLQYQCIGCAACIDGCNQVMERFGQARGLIRYATQHAMERKLDRAQILRRAFRPRVWLYSAVIWGIIVAAVAGLYLRIPLKVNVMPDRAAISRTVEGGQFENVYRLQVINTSESERSFEIGVSGLPGVQLAGETRITLGMTESRIVPVRVRVAPDAVAPGTHRVQFEVRAIGVDGVAVNERSVFVVR